MNPTTIQTIAAVIQAFASVVFCGSVVYDARRRAKLREQQRRYDLLNLITNQWAPQDGMTIEERCGKPSQRQIEFFNSKLREMGERWTYPLKPI